MVRDIGLPPGVDGPGAAAPVGNGAADPAATDLDLLRRRFGNVVGHALRTPIATVRGHLDSLERTDDPALRAQLVASLRRSADRLELMVDDLLLASGVETVLPTGAARREPLLAALRTVVGMLDQPLELHGTAGGDLDVRVPAGTLEPVLRALLDNAARYGDGTARVHLAAAEQAVRLELVTSTARTAVSQQDVAHAFAPFYRGERAVLTDGTRLGIGLTVARRYARHAGGEVSLRLGDGELTTVLELPS